MTREEINHALQAAENSIDGPLGSHFTMVAKLCRLAIRGLEAEKLVAALEECDEALGIIVANDYEDVRQYTNLIYSGSIMAREALAEWEKVK